MLNQYSSVLNQNNFVRKVRELDLEGRDISEINLFLGDFNLPPTSLSDLFLFVQGLREITRFSNFFSLT